MAVRVVEWKLPYTWGKAIEIDENKVISLRLRDENNLIIWDEGDNEIYVDLQLDDEIRPTNTFPVWITTGRVLVDNDWDKTGTLICAKTTSGDNIKLLYADDWTLWIDNWTGTFKQIYFKWDVDTLLASLRSYVDSQLATKQDTLTAGDNITIVNNVISATSSSGYGRFLSIWDASTGMPVSFPWTVPFTYQTWDYYLVENVGQTTNYRPAPTSYDWTASTLTESAGVSDGDTYIYDWTSWLLQVNSEKSVSFSNIAGQPSDNTNLANALNAKQDDMVVLSYWISTWADFLDAYNKNAVVYCRASSNTDPSTGTQWRMAFMAYVNNETNPTEVEFQYYRSVATHTDSTQWDQVFVYKLNSSTGWSVTTRNAYTKVAAGTGLSSSYSNWTITLNNTQTSAEWWNITGTLSNQTDLQNALDDKQDELVSGTNIKTINNSSILGSWNLTIDEGNTKSFTLTSLWSSATPIAEWQPVLDWYLAGNTPIVVYGTTVYTLYTVGGGRMRFLWALGKSQGSSTSYVYQWFLDINYNSSNTVTSTGMSSVSVSPDFLQTDRDYPTPYTPLYNGSPATKKYVDDSMRSLSETVGNLINIKYIWIPAGPDERAIWDDWSEVYSEMAAGFSVILTDRAYRTGYATNIYWAIITVVAWEYTYKITLDASNLTISAIEKVGEIRKFSSSIDTWSVWTNITDIVETILWWNTVCVFDTQTSLGVFYLARWWIPSTNVDLAFCNWIYIYELNATKSNDTWSIAAINWANIAFGPSNTWTTGQVLTKVSGGYQWDNLHAGEGIEIWTYNDYSAMRGPAPTWYHVPSKNEWVALYNAWVSLWIWDSSSWTPIQTYLKMPFAGYRSYSSSSVSSQGTSANYWSSTRSSESYAYYFYADSTSINAQYTTYPARAFSLRCFKDSPATPDSSWTVLYQWTWSAWVYRNSSLWLISISSDWTTWYTIQDKNLWATTVYNSWDTLSEANCGYYYQWWNNYWFPRTGTLTDTSWDMVDASAYWPWNYYSSSTFITRSTTPYRWDSTRNYNLRWWVTWVVTVNNAISNTWVLSVNGQTGDVTIADGYNIKVVSALPASPDSNTIYIVQ